MKTRQWMIASLLAAAFGTGCCYDQCGYYGNAYDPCTGLVEKKPGCFDKVKKAFDDDDCGCKKHKSKCGSGYDPLMYGNVMPHQGMGSNCPCNSQPGMIYPGTPTYPGSPIYPSTPTFSPAGPSEVYVSPEEFEQIEGTPMPVQPMKPVPAPAAEPDELPSETPTIPPASYVVPAPLDGPSVPVLKPYQG